jgi:hypothetical protein
MVTIPSTGSHIGGDEPEGVGFRRVSEKQFFVVNAGHNGNPAVIASFDPAKKPKKSITEYLSVTGVSSSAERASATSVV